MATKTVTAPNISCRHCVTTIQRELGGLPGVTLVRADATTKTITVDWDDRRTNWEQIRGLLTELDYPPTES